jgi:acetylornithine/N-succinyldiaminopimelate aminotransferase
MSPTTSLKKIRNQEAASLMQTYDRHAVLLTHGKGAYVYDDKGKKYLDCLSGIGVNALGHAHPALMKVIKKQSARMIHTSNLFFHEFQAPLSAKLCKMSGMNRVFFSNSGTEAWEGAMKLTRSYAKSTVKDGHKPKWKFLALDDSFHGRTYGSLSTTGQAKYRDPYGPNLPGVEFVKFNDIADLTAKMNDEVCAIMIEPVQGEGGIRPLTIDFMQAARNLANKHGALLILDEIQSGMGRTGKWFAYQNYGVAPDIITLAKPIAGGLPLGAFLCKEKVAKALKPGMHGTTFGGGPLACATALELIDVLERGKYLKQNSEKGARFLAQLKQLDAKHACILDVRGAGLMVGMELDNAELAKAVVVKLMERGIIINRTHERVLRFLPPFIITDRELTKLVQELDKALVELAPKFAEVAHDASSSRSAH